MGDSGGVRLDAESPRELVAEVEGHLRALLRDVLCGYLDADLKAVADDILIESNGEPLGEIEAHDLREATAGGARTAARARAALRPRARGRAR